ncbi:MAG: substrate-binding domain-containing protein [Treponema sp.]|nr:substrate-binding domain-containing protein [Treponema sp.]
MPANEEIRLWSSGKRPVPPRPEFPEIYPETDERHWYDLEFAGWDAPREGQPLSPGDGPAGKKIISIHHLGGHPYMAEYDRGLLREAERFGMELEILHSGWDPELEAELVRRAVRERPDLIIICPEQAVGSAALFRKVHAAGIPLIASNLLPEREAFRHLVAWTGPDDWGQFRLLARRFAELMGGEGGYCLVNHIPGSSAHIARHWAVVTELAKMAPRMELLDVADTGLDTSATKDAVLAWLRRFGKKLGGIISADDSLAQLGVNLALEESGREDILRVANGATTMGMRFIKEGKLAAITWQSPELDGALAIRTAADWFNGLAVEPIRYLPLSLIDPGDIDEFLLMGQERPPVDLDLLSHLVADCDARGVERFFDDLLVRFRQERILPEEWFRGFSIELLSRLAAIARAAEPPLTDLYSNYESLFKQLFLQPTPVDTLAWLRGLAGRIMEGLQARRNECIPLADRLRGHIEVHFREAMSLKLLAGRFGISAAYLGKVFREGNGCSFSAYLNEIRVAAALRILQTRKVKAKEVAAAVGYSDADYFCSVFRKLTGMHPSKVEIENRGEA